MSDTVHNQLSIAADPKTLEKIMDEFKDEFGTEIPEGLMCQDPSDEFLCFDDLSDEFLCFDFITYNSPACQLAKRLSEKYNVSCVLYCKDYCQDYDSFGMFACDNGNVISDIALETFYIV